MNHLNKFNIELQLHLGTSGLEIASTLNLESGPRFAEACFQPHKLNYFHKYWARGLHNLNTSGKSGWHIRVEPWACITWICLVYTMKVWYNMVWQGRARGLHNLNTWTHLENQDYKMTFEWCKYGKVYDGNSKSQNWRWEERGQMQSPPVSLNNFLPYN